MIYIVDKTSPQLSTLYAEVVSEYCGVSYTIKQIPTLAIIGRSAELEVEGRPLPLHDPHHSHHSHPHWPSLLPSPPPQNTHQLVSEASCSQSPPPSPPSYISS